MYFLPVEDGEEISLAGSVDLFGFFGFRLFFIVGHVRAFTAGQSLDERPYKEHAAANNDRRDDRYRNNKNGLAHCVAPFDWLPPRAAASSSR